MLQHLSFCANSIILRIPELVSVVRKDKAIPLKFLKSIQFITIFLKNTLD